MNRLVWMLGAMAAERVFFDKTTTGVGGDIQSATGRAAFMVGACGMAPEPIELPETFADETREETEERIGKRFEKIGLQLMNRTAEPGHGDPIAGVLSDRDKRAMAAQIIGQAYVRAYNLIATNKEAVNSIAETLIERREILGDELLATLDRARLARPEIDLTQEAAWPKM
jgi:ATP-dependent Zn protease